MVQMVPTFSPPSYTFPQISPLDVPELLSDIAAHLPARVSFDDAAKQDLAACSFVSKQWRATYLPHLFYDVTRSFPAETSPNHPTKTPEAFVSFLTENPEIGKLIRCLRLAGIPGEYGDVALIQLCSFYEILRHLPALRDLTLHNTLISTERDRQLDPPKTKPSLRTLSVYADSGVPLFLNGLMGNLTTLHKIEELRISGNWELRGLAQVQHHPDWRLNAPDVAAMSSLVLQDVYQLFSLLHLMAGITSTKSLRTLVLGHVPSLCVTGLQNLVDRAKSHLQHFCLSMEPNHYVEGPAHSTHLVSKLNLSVCRKLQTLSLRIAIPNIACNLETVMWILSNLLQSAPPLPHLHTVTFTFHTSHLPEHIDPIIPRIQEVSLAAYEVPLLLLMSNNPETGKCVRIELDLPKEYGERKAALQMRFRVKVSKLWSRLSTQNLLRFEDV